MLFSYLVLKNKWRWNVDDTVQAKLTRNVCVYTRFHLCRIRKVMLISQKHSKSKMWCKFVCFNLQNNVWNSCLLQVIRGKPQIPLCQLFASHTVLRAISQYNISSYGRAISHFKKKSSPINAEFAHSYNYKNYEWNLLRSTNSLKRMKKCTLTHCHCGESCMQLETFILNTL